MFSPSTEAVDAHHRRRCHPHRLPRSFVSTHQSIHELTDDCPNNSQTPTLTCNTRAHTVSFHSLSSFPEVSAAEVPVDAESSASKFEISFVNMWSRVLQRRPPLLLPLKPRVWTDFAERRATRCNISYRIWHESPRLHVRSIKMCRCS